LRGDVHKSSNQLLAHKRLKDLSDYFMLDKANLVTEIRYAYIPRKIRRSSEIDLNKIARSTL